MPQPDLFPGTQSPCNQSQAISSLIKSVRLRRVEDAVYWFFHFAHFFPEQKFRLLRRLLIIAAEDCTVVPVQLAVGEFFWKATNSKDSKFWLTGGAQMLHLICATPNWWATDEGNHYTVVWRRVERAFKELSQADKKALADASMDFQEPTATLLQHTARIKVEEFDKTVYAHQLSEVARERDNLPARHIASMARRFGKALTWDENWIGQAVYRILYRDLGHEEYPKVNPQHVKDSVDLARFRLNTPEKAPAWSLDGIHTGGDDNRFAGALPQMVGCCNAFQVYGRLDPADPHPAEFYSTTKILEALKAKGFSRPMVG